MSNLVLAISDTWRIREWLHQRQRWFCHMPLFNGGAWIVKKHIEKHQERISRCVWSSRERKRSISAILLAEVFWWSQLTACSDFLFLLHVERYYDLFSGSEIEDDECKNVAETLQREVVRKKTTEQLCFQVSKSTPTCYRWLSKRRKRYELISIRSHTVRVPYALM